MGCSFLLHHFLLWRVPDYLMIIILAIIAAVIGAKVRPHCRSFEWTDPSINHPFATKEAFPMYSVIIAVVLVALVYLAGELCTRWRRPVGKLNMCLHVNGWIVTHAFSILLAFIFVNVSKLYAGRLRPDFLARLAQEGITEANAATLTHAQLCHAAREGRLSFPSGHSGTAFSGFVPPCIYLLGLMRTLNGGKVWLAVIALFPLILPVAVAVSRTDDYRHNFDDILAGSLCGTFCGIFAVFISFRVSRRGEWTLRDHPDDVGATRVWMRDLLRSEDGILLDAVDGEGVAVGGAAVPQAEPHSEPAQTAKSVHSSSPPSHSWVPETSGGHPPTGQPKQAAHSLPSPAATHNGGHRKSTGDSGTVEQFFPTE